MKPAPPATSAVFTRAWSPHLGAARGPRRHHPAGAHSIRSAPKSLNSHQPLATPAHAPATTGCRGVPCGRPDLPPSGPAQGSHQGCLYHGSAQTPERSDLERADARDRKRRRRPLRLPGYDYSQTGVYFLTVAVQRRSCLFGEVIGQQMHLSAAGEMACRVWQALPERFPIIFDAFVVMPNHMHGLVGIDFGLGAGAPLVGARPPFHRDQDRAATRVAPTPGRVALGDVIGAYKSLVTVEYIRGVQELNWPPFDGRLWQRRYYEHIVRNEESLNHLRQYVQDNPARWALDCENPLAERPEDP